MQQSLTEGQIDKARLIDLEITADYMGTLLYDQALELAEMKATIQAQRDLLFKLYGIVLGDDFSRLKD